MGDTCVIEDLIPILKDFKISKNGGEPILYTEKIVQGHIWSKNKLNMSKDKHMDAKQEGPGET